MKFLPSFLTRKKIQPPAPQQTAVRRWVAANVNRLTSGWPTAYMSPDYEVYTDLKRLRALSRSLGQNNNYVRHYLNLMQIHVVGPTGMQFQPRIVNPKTQEMAQDINDELSKAWGHWCCAASLDGQFSFLDIEQQIIRSVPEGGEVLVRLIKGAGVNAYGFALQLIEGELLDHLYNRAPSNGQNAIVQGIEKDAFGRPVAYHCWTGYEDAGIYGGHRERVAYPAAEIIHLFRPDRPNQTRGVPWFAGVIPDLAFLDQYMNAELIASLASSEMYATIESDTQADGSQQYPPPQPPTVDSNASGNGTQEAEVSLKYGSVLDAGPGRKIVPWMANRPNTQFDPFVKTMLHKIAAGLHISYSTLASDMSEDNYSSARMSALLERDYYRNLQQWMVRNFHMEVYRHWLECTMLATDIRLPSSNPNDYMDVLFRPRSWKYNDPSKEIEAYDKAIKLGLVSKTQVVSEMGLDFADVSAERYEEEKIERQNEKDLQEQELLPVEVQTENAKVTTRESTTGPTPTNPDQPVAPTPEAVPSGSVN